MVQNGCKQLTDFTLQGAKCYYQGNYNIEYRTVPCGAFFDVMEHLASLTSLEYVTLKLLSTPDDHGNHLLFLFFCLLFFRK